MPSPTCQYEELAHTAEIGFRVWADDAPGLFACAARALFALTGAEGAAASAETRSVRLESGDAESLLVDWLSELVWLYETTGLLFAHAEVAEWSPTALLATVHGAQPTQPPRLHVKAITYHGLELAQTEAGWTATIYLDI